MTPDDAGPPSDRPTAPSGGGPGDAGAGRLVGGRYRLIRGLGRGGMGVVWAARDETLDRDVAVKEVTLPPGLDERQRDQLRGRTLREARAAARIRNQAAVTVYDVVEEDGRPWIVMELLPPRSLADVVREEGPLPPVEAARTGLRLLDALAAAHAAGVLHRDVKPANVLFDASGSAVLTDFGIASLEGDPSMTTTGAVVGSPGYVAPERALGRPPSPASDLWSLGVTLATAVHGRSPFEKESPLATIVSAMQDPLPDTVVTGPLGPVIQQLLHKDPTQRPDAARTRRLLEAEATGRATPDTTVMPSVHAAPRPEHERSATASSADAELTQALPPVPGSRATRTAGGPDASSAASRTRATATGAPSRPGPPRPGAAGTGRRSRLLPLLVALAAVVAAVMVVAVALDRRDGALAAPEGGTDVPASGAPAATAQAPTDDADAGAAPDPVPEDPATPEPAPEDTAALPPAQPGPQPDDGDEDEGTAAGQVPEGFQAYEDPSYRVAVPEAWTVEVDGESRTTFRDPASRRYLLVEEGGEPTGDPVEDWERQEASVSERLAGYELLGIERADYRDFDAADWQFRWDASGGRLRVLNRNVVDPGLDRAYALYWSVPDEDWDASRPLFDSIARGFRPRG